MRKGIIMSKVLACNTAVAFVVLERKSLCLIQEHLDDVEIQSRLLRLDIRYCSAKCDKI